jgi:hypothetical protein
MSVLTAKRVSVEIVDEAICARAHNLEQNRLIHDASPECDSLVEAINALTGLVEPERITLMLDLTLKLAQSNAAEGEHERTIAGAGERMVHALRPTAGRQSLNRRDLAERLRPILDDLAAGTGTDPMVYVRAARDLAAVQREVPLKTLLSPSLANQLGEGRTRLLHELISAEASS